MAQTGAKPDPYRNYNFLVEIDGVAQASFRECDGLETTSEVVEYREGGDNSSVRKLPGRASHGDITLKWGSTDSSELWDWRESVVAGVFERKNGSIVLYDLANQTEVRRWNFLRGWPSKWEGPSLDATGNDVSLETLTIVHEGLKQG